jgi:hypothetical protein
MKCDFRQMQAIVRGNHVTWRGPIQHTPGGTLYDVLIDFSWPQRPKIWVQHPPLTTRPGKRIPHQYEDGSLCVHLVNEWHAGKFISQTIVPWIAHWLLHYEIWLSTGEWLGGGVHPEG